MTMPTARPSASRLTWGLVLLLVGQVLYSGGQQAALRNALNTYRDSGSSDGVIIVGAIVSFVGLVQLVVGVHRLAHSVDTMMGLMLIDATEDQEPPEEEPTVGSREQD